VSESARAVFQAHAEGYDAERRRLLPCFDAFYAAAIDALGLCERPLRREVYSAEQMEDHGRRLAATHRVTRERGPDDLLARLAEGPQHPGLVLRVESQVRLGLEQVAATDQDGHLAALGLAGAAPG